MIFGVSRETRMTRMTWPTRRRQACASAHHGSLAEFGLSSVDYAGSKPMDETRRMTQAGDSKPFLIEVTEANLRQSHLYLNGARSLFPRDCFGASTIRKGIGSLIRLDVEGLAEPVLTDIPSDARTGRPRGFFRKRGWVGEFFRAHDTSAGDRVAVHDRLSNGDSTQSTRDA